MKTTSKLPVTVRCTYNSVNSALKALAHLSSSVSQRNTVYQLFLTMCHTLSDVYLTDDCCGFHKLGGVQDGNAPEAVDQSTGISFPNPHNDTRHSGMAILSPPPARPTHEEHS